MNVLKKIRLMSLVLVLTGMLAACASEPKQDPIYGVVGPGSTPPQGEPQGRVIRPGQGQGQQQPAPDEQPQGRVIRGQ